MRSVFNQQSCVYHIRAVIYIYIYSFYRSMYVMFVHSSYTGRNLYIHINVYRETCISRWCRTLSDAYYVYIYFFLVVVLPWFYCLHVIYCRARALIANVNCWLWPTLNKVYLILYYQTNNKETPKSPLLALAKGNYWQLLHTPNMEPVIQKALKLQAFTKNEK